MKEDFLRIVKNFKLQQYVFLSLYLQYYNNRLKQFLSMEG